MLFQYNFFITGQLSQNGISYWDYQRLVSFGQLVKQRPIKSETSETKSEIKKLRDIVIISCILLKLIPPLSAAEI